MRSDMQNWNLFSAGNDVRYKDGMYEQDLAVSYDVSYLLAELLERTQL